MLVRDWICGLINFSLMVALSLSSFAIAQKSKDEVVPEGRPVLWQEPADIASRDLYHGSGGEAGMPDISKVTFLKDESSTGYSKKYRVRDAQGKTWVAKLSKEAPPETVANRLVWAIGYPTEIGYMIPRVTIEGKGSFENVRFEARPEGIKRLDPWSWDNNPFIGTPEFQGLKVMMVLLNNWDIKDDNTKVLQVKSEAGENELHYIVSDLGATLGKTGNFMSRTRNKPEDYVKSKFITGVKGNFVEFNYNGKRKDLFRNITVEQVKWVADLLSRLSDKQITDAFRAGNYSPEEVEVLADAFRARVKEMAALSTGGH